MIDCHRSNPLVGYNLQFPRFWMNTEQPEEPYCHLDHQLNTETRKEWETLVLKF